MAFYNRLGYTPDQIICEDMALPNGTTVGNLTATNTVTLNATDADVLRVIICAASTTVAIANAATISFTPLFGNNAAAGGCLIRALGTMTLTGGDVTLVDGGNVTTKDLPDPLSWTSGTLMYAFDIPKELCAAYKYMKLNIACSADESSENIEAFVITV